MSNFLSLSLELSIPLFFFSFLFSRFFLVFLFVLQLFLLILLFLTVMISLSSLVFFVNSLSPKIVTSTQLSMLVSRYMSSFWWKALCIIIDFLVLWSIYLSSILVHFKNVLEYFTRVTTQVFILWKTFLLQSLVLRSYLVLLRYFLLFFFFFFFTFLDWFLQSVSHILRYLQFSFSQNLLNSLIIIIIFIIILLLFEFSTLALTDGFSLEFEWLQVSSSFQDFSQYSGRS